MSRLVGDGSVQRRTCDIGSPELVVLVQARVETTSKCCPTTSKSVDEDGEDA